MTTLYDEVPYPTSATRDTHPDSLAAMATLFGMEPAPVTRCRVLELACGNGGNLIPMAFNLPESRFTGIDLAETPVAEGNRLIAGVGLRNISLEARDVLSIPPDFGEFDYIIAHGLYSWVPPAVQEKILAVCRAHLAPEGVAFVSYNALPGARLRLIPRDLIQYFVRPFDASPRTRERAMELLAFTKVARPQAGRFAELGAQVSAFAASRDSGVLLHDDLAEHFRPVYFHEFAAHADRHGLQFLGEATLQEMNDRWLKPEETELLDGLDGDRIVNREQYVDFLKCRQFRQTLLCRKERPLRRDRVLESLLKLQVSSDLRPVSERPDLESPAPETFQSPKGGTITTEYPPVKQLLALLAGEWPRPVRIADLVPAGVDPSAVTNLLLGLCYSGAVGFRTHWIPYVLKAGERPEASALARGQLRFQGRVTNQEHADIQMQDAIARALVEKLDGTRTRAQLLAELAPVAPDATPDTLESSLKSLGHLALLTG